MIEYLQPAAVPESDAPFSQVAVDDHYVHLAGLVAADFPEGLKVLGDVARETSEVLKVVEKILSELDLSMSDIVRMDVHLASLEDFDAMDNAYRDHFPRGKYPARTTTESPHLFGGSKVELTCMAERRRRR